MGQGVSADLTITESYFWSLHFAVKVQFPFIFLSGALTLIVHSVYIQSVDGFPAEIGSSGHGFISAYVAGDLACPMALLCVILGASNLSWQSLCSDSLCVL